MSDLQLVHIYASIIATLVLLANILFVSHKRTITSWQSLIISGLYITGATRMLLDDLVGAGFTWVAMCIIIAAYGYNFRNRKRSSITSNGMVRGPQNVYPTTFTEAGMFATLLLAGICLYIFHYLFPFLPIVNVLLVVCYLTLVLSFARSMRIPTLWFILILALVLSLGSLFSLITLGLITVETPLPRVLSSIVELASWLLPVATLLTLLIQRLYRGAG